MKNLLKGKFATILVILATIILAGIAIFTAIRLYNLRQQAVAPNVPSSIPKAAEVSASPSSTPIPKYFKESNTLIFNRAGTVIVHTTRKVDLTLTPVGTTLEGKKLVQTFDHTKTETFKVNVGDSYTIGARFFNDKGEQDPALGWRKPYNPTTCGNEATGHKVDIGALVSSIQASSSLNLDPPDVLNYPILCWADAPNACWDESKHKVKDTDKCKNSGGDPFGDTYDFNDARIIFSYDIGAVTAPLCSSNAIERNENNTWVEIKPSDIQLGDVVRFIAVVINPAATTKVQIRISLDGSVVKDWAEATASTTAGDYYLEYTVSQAGSYSVEERIE